MRPSEFADSTAKELDALVYGYRRRYEIMEDLLILHVALPVYRGAWGRKAPTYKKLTAHRTQWRKVGEIDAETAEYWRGVLESIK